MSRAKSTRLYGSTRGALRSSRISRPAVEKSPPRIVGARRNWPRPSPHAGFYAERDRARNYALANALCYYLLRGAPSLGEKNFAAIPALYIGELRRTRDLNKARELAFAGVDFDELYAKLKAFWNSPEQQLRAREYRKTR